MDSETNQKLINEIVEKDFRIFQFRVQARTPQSVLEQRKWNLPLSFVYETLISCPSCKKIILNECMREMEKVELCKALTSKDKTEKFNAEAALEGFVKMYDDLNPDEDEKSGKKEKKVENPK